MTDEEIKRIGTLAENNALTMEQICLILGDGDVKLGRCTLGQVAYMYLKKRVLVANSSSRYSEGRYLDAVIDCIDGIHGLPAPGGHKPCTDEQRRRRDSLMLTMIVIAMFIYAGRSGNAKYDRSDVLAGLPGLPDPFAL